MDRLYLGTASWLMVVCGAWLVVNSAVDLHTSSGAESWPTVEGRITELHTARLAAGRFLPLQTWTAPSYEYRVGTVRYEGARLAFGGILPRELQREPLTAGSPVTVYYNPADPREAVLYPGGRTGFLVYGTVGAFLLLVGVALRRHSARLPAPGKRRRRRR